MFTGSLGLLVTRERERDLREAAEARRRLFGLATPVTRVVLRQAAAADRGLLRELARLDSSRPIGSRALVAEVDGRLRAAVDLEDGAAIADPFFQGGELVELLRLRARQLSVA